MNAQAGCPEHEAKARSRRAQRTRHRIRTQRQLDYMRRHGQSRAGRLCVVVAADPLDGIPRVGFRISKRYSPKAVHRNRARRLLREAYRGLRPRLKCRWILLIPRWRMPTARTQDVARDMERTAAELGILNEHDGGDETRRTMTP